MSLPDPFSFETLNAITQILGFFEKLLNIFGDLKKTGENKLQNLILFVKRLGGDYNFKY